MRILFISSFFLVWLFYSPFILNAQYKGSDIHIRVADEPHELNPYCSNTAVGSNINEYLFMSLMGVDKSTGLYVPLIAEDAPSISEDELIFTYTIHPEARFNNKKPITADDIVFSMKVIKNPMVANQHHKSDFDVIKNVIAEDKRRVSFYLKTQSPQSIRVTGDFAIFSEDLFDPGHKLREVSLQGIHKPKKLGPMQNEAVKNVAQAINAFGLDFESYNEDGGNGAYIVQSWNPGDLGEVVLGYNKRFWGRKLDAPRNHFFKQNIETIHFHSIKDELKVREMVFSKNLDMVTGISAKVFHDLTGLPPKYVGAYRFLEGKNYGYTYAYIGLNSRGAELGRVGYFSEFPARRAMAHMVDVTYMLEALQYTLGDRMASDYLSTSDKIKNEDLELIPQNLDLARQLLTASGWADNDDDGILDKLKDGDRIKFAPILIYDEGNDLRESIAKYLKETGKKIGIQIKPKALPKKEYLAALKSKEFDMCLGAWVPDPNEDSYKQIWHSKNWKKGYNWAGFGNAYSDQLIEQYEAEPDHKKRKELAMRIQQIIYDGQPYVFLWHTFETFILKKNLAGAKTYDVRPGYWIGEWEPKEE